MSNLKSYLVSRSTVEKALAEDGMELEDFDQTIIGLVSDGEEWQVLEDSLDEEEALAWAKRAEGYGEIVGLFEWPGQA